MSIARLLSPPNCTYLSLEDQRLLTFAGRLDTVVTRHFYIHQNFANATWATKLAAYLLKPGGTLVADFYLPDPGTKQFVVHKARSPLDQKYPSCTFLFTAEEIQEIAEIGQFSIVETKDNLKVQRRFVRMRRR